MNKEDFITEILWKIIEGKYESHQLLNEKFFVENDEFEEIVKSQFDEFSKIFCSDEVIGYVYGWIDQAVPEVVFEDFLFAVFNKFVKYIPEQNGDSGVLVFCKDSFYTFELSREKNSIAVNVYQMTNELNRNARKILR